jgi:hypothetical protein
MVAKAADVIGTVIKFCGVLVAVVFICAGISLGSNSRDQILIYGGIGLGVVAGVPIFVLGVLVSAISQLTKAAVDGAVNTSPFLSVAQKAEAMSLSDG